jgi:transposase
LSNILGVACEASGPRKGPKWIGRRSGEGGFHVLPRRWVVERTFAWLSTWRRLAKDYELLPSSEEAWIYLAMIRIMLRRLAQNSS